MQKAKKIIAMICLTVISLALANCGGSAELKSVDEESHNPATDPIETEPETEKMTITETPKPAELVASRMLHAEGNKILNDKGEEVRLAGVNVCSLEWSNTGENVLNSVYEVFTNWNCNIIRLPLSQDRWFGKVKGQKDGGDEYKNIVDKVVKLASDFGKYVELDLHWSNAGEWGKNISQHFMPDENSLEFWLDIAKRYANHPSVIFNLYNEPHDISWEVWRDGGTITEIANKGKANEKILTYETPGHQKILEEIRALGAKNIITAGGLDWGYDLSGIKTKANGATYALTDSPGGNGIIYETHIYPWKSDMKNKVLCIVNDYPIIVGEIGINAVDGTNGADKKPKWMPDMLNWMDENNLHWTGWCLHPGATPNMITGWDYTPTEWHGALMKERLLSYPDTNAHLAELPKKPR